jgi:hypothetical protein
VGLVAWQARRSSIFHPWATSGTSIRPSRRRRAIRCWPAWAGHGPIDYNAASRALLSAGDPEGFSLAKLAESSSRDTRDFGFRQQESNRAQANADRAFELQKQQAEEAARGFDYREIDDGNGGKMLVRINKATSEINKPDITGAQTAPNNPYAYGKQTEGQSKDSGYANRMFRAEGVLRDPAVEAAAVDLKENLLGKAPGFISNYLTGPNYQKFDQAKRDFVNAVLRRESGAAISSSEFDNAHKQYFPQPGDTPERIAEKRKNRQDAIAGVAGGGGQTYKPPATFSPDGTMVPTGNPAQGATPPPAPAPKPGVIDKAAIQAARANPQGALAEAQAAIKNGADPQAVALRLQRVGINPALLTGGDRPGFASPDQRQ